MPVPTNLSAATAQALGSLPATITQQVDDAGTTYTTWYSFVAPANTVVVGAFGYGDATVYTPTTTAWEGPSGAPTQMVAGNTIPGGANLAIQFPVMIGSTYFLKVTPNGGNPTPANLTLSVESAANQSAITAGAILINDDTSGFPLAILPPSGGVPTRFVQPFVAGEAGEMLDSGISLWEDIDLAGVVLVDQDLATMTSVVDTHHRHISSNHTDTFYVASRGLGLTDASVITVSDAGVVGPTTWTLPDAGLVGLAPSADETILFVIGQVSADNTAIQRWDLVNSVMLSDLTTAITGTWNQDLLCVLNGTLVIGSFAHAGTCTVKAWDTSGSVVWSTDLPTTIVATDTRKCRYPNSDDSQILVWGHDHSGADAGRSRFFVITTSDGTIADTFDSMEFETGTYQGTATATPIQRFGHSFSCPVVAYPSGVSPTTRHFVMRRERRFLLPSSPDNKFMQIPTLELLMRTGIGLTPGDAANPPVLGSDPHVMMRISKDGGQTWLPERWVSAGTIGQYVARARWLQATGNYRNAVCEITVSDPVDWQFLAMEGTPKEGTS